LEKEKDDSEEWLCVEAPQLDDYLEMYTRGGSGSAGDIGSTYDFRLITDAIKNFIDRPGKTASSASSQRRDPLDGVDFKPLSKRVTEDDVLVDFNLDSIEECVKEYLSGGGNKSGGQQDIDEEESGDESDEEDDSFYAVGDDLNEDEVEDSEDYETNKLTDSLKNYMSTMDEELKEQKNLSRLDGHHHDPLKTGGSNTSKSSKSKNGKEACSAVDELDIDLNLVSNALESYSSQLGLSGPVSNILKSLGI
jgi:hypothetical protein